MTVSEEADVPVLRARRVCVELLGARSRVLRRRFAPTRVVDGLDVEVHAGDLVWIVGRPGEGALEAGRVLAGVLAATSGVVELNGRALAPSRGRRRTRTQRQLAWLDAEAAVRLNPGSTALEVVAKAASGSSRSVSAEHTAHAQNLLARLGLGTDAHEQRAASLSAAEAHLVDAARVLASRPRVVVYRSPAGCDLDSDPVWVVLTELRETASTAVVAIGGGLPARLDPGNRVLVLCGGRVVEVLRHGDLTHPLHPYTLTLAGSSVRTASGGPGVSSGSEPRARDADETCPFRGDCPRAKPRCATEVPRLTRPLGATHEVACHFPEDPRRPEGAAAAGAGARGDMAGPVDPVVAPGHADEPTAREFAEG